MYYVLRITGAANIILADFNLVVSTPTAKLPNLNPRQISGYTYIYIYGSQCKFMRHGQLCPICTLYEKPYYCQRSTSMYLVEVQDHFQVLSESHTVGCCYCDSVCVTLLWSYSLSLYWACVAAFSHPPECISIPTQVIWARDVDIVGINRFSHASSVVVHSKWRWTAVLGGMSQVECLEQLAGLGTQYVCEKQRTDMLIYCFA